MTKGTGERHLIIVRGMPGSGDYEFAESLASITPNSTHLGRDMWMADRPAPVRVRDDMYRTCPKCDEGTPEGCTKCFECGETIAEYKFDESRLTWAYEQCWDMTRRLLNAWYDPKLVAPTVIVSDNFLTEQDVHPYSNMVHTDNGLNVREGFKLTVISLFDGGKSDWVLYQNNTRGVPLDVIKECRKRYDHTIDLRTLTEAWDEEHDMNAIQVGDEVCTPDYYGAKVVAVTEDGDRIQTEHYDAKDGGDVKIWHCSSRIQLIRKQGT